jgi:molecular chaperone GrpE
VDKEELTVTEEKKVETVTETEIETETEKEEVQKATEPIENLQAAQDDSLKSELDKLNDRYLRLQAEYSNFRRRTEEEKGNIYRLGNERLIVELLPVLDNFNRAIENMQSNDVPKSYLDGVEMIRKSLLKVLEKEGLQCIDACGKDFDPENHHAVLMEDCDKNDPGIVLEELQKGYKLKDKMIRPTMVKVSK